MTKLKLKTIEDDKPVDRMVKFPGVVYRDLTAYAELLTRDSTMAAASSMHLLAFRSEQFETRAVSSAQF